MIKGAFDFTQILSLLAIVAYLYLRTKDKSTLWFFLYWLYFGILAVTFKTLFPDISCPSPTIEYTVALILAGIPFLIMIVLIAMEFEKNREKATQNLSSIFTINKSNLIFWGCIIFLNLIGFLLEKNK